MAQKTLTVNPSGYNTSHTSAGTVSNISNAYTNSASTTYATVATNTSSRTASSYISFTFDVSSIPSTATIDSVACYAKGAVSTTSTTRTGTFVAQLYNGTTAMGSSASIGAKTAATAANITTTGTWTRTTLDNLELRFTHTRSNSTNSVSMYIYGADLVITYTTVDNVTITTTITNGVLISPTTASMEVEKGSSATLTFSGNADQVLSSMTVDGTEVSPTWVESSETKAYVTIDSTNATATTNTSAYNSTTISSIIDGDVSTYYWDNSTQAAGDYMMITLASAITIETIQTTATFSSTDYPQSNCQLQISTDGTNWITAATYADGSQTQTFSINQKCQYIRWYITSAANYWWGMNEVYITGYTGASVEAHYEYTISSVTGDTTVTIVFGPEGPVLYVKTGNRTWEAVKKIYQKTDSGWVTVSVEDFQISATSDNYKFVWADNPVEVSTVGTVTSNTNAISLDTDKLDSDTYTLYYEDDTNTPLDNWNPITTITI